MAVNIQIRNDTAANWTSANPTLLVGELGVETDTGFFKLGDGSTAWTSLGYVNQYFKFAEVVAAATGSLTAAQVSNTLINNYGQTVANTQTLPACAAGYNFRAIVTTTGMGAFSIKPGGSDVIYLDGTALAANHKVSFATPALMNQWSFMAVKTGVSTYVWNCLTINGVSSDGGT